MLKLVAERGNHTDGVQEASLAFEKGNPELALIKSLLVAEQGLEIAQANTVYLLENHLLNLNDTQGASATSIALTNLLRAAAQGNVDAKVRVGDYHYEGIGIEADLTKAASYYTLAEHANSAQAMFNLGYMHEHGVGLKQDLHLAKRYYDRAILASEDAYFPVSLALLNLAIKFLFEGELLLFLELDPAVTTFNLSLLSAVSEGFIFFSLGTALGALLFVRLVYR